VVVPVYKVEKYLPACLDSVLGQSLRELECICIDDASPDRCGEILDEYAARDERVRVLHLPENQTRLLMSYEYRYPVGQFLLSPVAGLLDPEDRSEAEPLVSAAIREIKEECGLTVRETDKVYVLNPCAFSTPGMTDESNAFLCAEITLDSLDGLNQKGAVGTEMFNGYELLDKERARKIFQAGRDEHGNFYSLPAWMVLSIFLTMF
jgi:ADP-ribose pyrophosphatase